MITIRTLGLAILGGLPVLDLPLEGVDFRPDGRYVVTAGDDGMVRVFVVAIDDLMNLARSRLSRGFTDEECRTYLHQAACVED